MSPEKRKNKRVPFVLLAAVRTEDADLMCPARDLSEGGLCLIYQGGALAVGQTVGVDFELPDSDRTIQLAGRVVRVAGDHVGIEFGGLKPPVRRAIQKYVADTHY